MRFAAALIVTGGQDKTVLVHSTDQGMQGMFACITSALNMYVVYVFALFFSCHIYCFSLYCVGGKLAGN